MSCAKCGTYKVRGIGLSGQPFEMDWSRYCECAAPQPQTAISEELTLSPDTVQKLIDREPRGARDEGIERALSFRRTGWHMGN